VPQRDRHKQLAANRRAFRDYSVLERFEAGIELRGTEVKSIRSGQASLAGAYARVENGEIFLHGFHVPSYEHGGSFNHDPDRPRRLLLHGREIHKLRGQTEQKGLALVPLNVYLERNLVKIELGLCRGKRRGDKRETLKRKTADREAARAIARRRD